LSDRLLDAMQERILEQARVLVVDDDAQNVRYIKDVLEWAGYQHVKGTTQPSEVLSETHRYGPDLILLDLIMPEMDGYEVMEVLQAELPPESYLPILVLTSDTSQEAKRRALSLGAKDFLTKPFSPTEIRHRVENLLETRFLHLKCRDQAALLESGASAGGADSRKAADELIERLARVSSYRSDPSGDRSRAVAVLAGRIADALGQADGTVRSLERAARLYDIGMVAATGQEVRAGLDRGESFPAHTEIGAGLLAGSELPELRMAAEIALSHHECWNGSGFPDGLRGQDIPVAARIVAVALGFTAAREEEPPDDDEEASQRALAHVEEEAGTRYDPVVVDALAAVMTRVAEAPA
jgi:putative two-component system response regulator